jgi:hypothetical protein
LDKERYVSDLLRTAVVTGAWLLAQSIFGWFVLRPRGRPYKAIFVVIHIALFLPIAAGWCFTVYALSIAGGPRAGTWIAEVVMGLAVLSQLIVGLILTAGRKRPAPGGFVLVHTIGMPTALLGSLAGIVCTLLGV